MSEKRPLISPKFNGSSFLEDNGIFLGTKQNHPVSRSIKPPRIISKSFNLSTPLSCHPKCVAGRHFGIFPSPLYDKQCDKSYLNQCFDILHKIGEGSFGSVYKVRRKEDNKLYAVKVFKEPFKNKFHRNMVLEEVKRHEQLSAHPNIVTLYQAWEDEGVLYILLELCETSLQIYTESHHNINENTVWDILYDIVSAVKFIHDRNLIHMDIKLENILLTDDGTYKLSDFGLIIDSTRPSASIEALEGDPKYLAPEVMNGKFTKAADIFSLGISILEVTGDLILPGNGEAWHQLRQGVLPQHTAKLSTELNQLITGMMLPNPNMRLTVDDVLKTPTLQRKLKRHRINNFYKRFKRFARKLYNKVSYPFNRLVSLWNKLTSLFSRNKVNINNNNNNKKIRYSPTPPPCSTPFLDARSDEIGIGHSTPLYHEEILNISKITPAGFALTPTSTKQRKSLINQKRMFARRKLHLNFSDDSD